MPEVSKTTRTTIMAIQMLTIIINDNVNIIVMRVIVSFENEDINAVFSKLNSTVNSENRYPL